MKYKSSLNEKVMQLGSVSSSLPANYNNDFFISMKAKCVASDWSQILSLSLSLFPSPFFLFLQFNSCITHFHNAGLTLENGHWLIQRNWKMVSESTCSTGRPLVSSILGSMPSDASDYVVGLIASKVTFDSVYLSVCHSSQISLLRISSNDSCDGKPGPFAKLHLGWC